MREIPQIRETILQRMEKFGRRVQKRSLFFCRFKCIIEHDFASIIEEDVNVCVCCEVHFKGKSIGPHYKNNKKCAQFKANLRRARPKVTREPMPVESNEPKKETEEFRTVENHVNYDIFESSEENLEVDLDDVDDFFYSE